MHKKEAYQHLVALCTAKLKKNIFFQGVDHCLGVNQLQKFHSCVGAIANRGQWEQGCCSACKSPGG